MGEKRPEYGFTQIQDMAKQGRPWIVQGKGGSASAGNFTVGGKNIVSLYNKCEHQRTAEELDLMEELNRAFQTGQVEEAKALHARAKAELPACAKAARNAYAKELGIQPEE